MNKYSLQCAEMEEEILFENFIDNSEYAIAGELIDIAEGRHTLATQRLIDDIQDSREYSSDYRSDWLMRRRDARYG